MAFAIASNRITQTGTDTNIDGLSSITGVTTYSTGNRDYYVLPNTCTEIEFQGTISWNPDEQCIVGGTDTRFWFNGCTLTWPAYANGSYASGTGIVCRRSWDGANGTRNPSTTSNNASRYLQVANSTTVTLYGGRIETAGMFFVGSDTSTGDNGGITLLMDQTEMVSINTNVNATGAAMHIFRIFAMTNLGGVFTEIANPCDIRLKNVSLITLTGSASATYFSRLPLQEIGFNFIAGTIACDGNGAGPVLYIDGGDSTQNRENFTWYGNYASNPAVLNKGVFRNHKMNSTFQVASSFNNPANALADFTKDVTIYAIALEDQSVIKGANARAVTVACPSGFDGITGTRYLADGGIDNEKFYNQENVYEWTTDSDGTSASDQMLYAVCWMEDAGGEANTPNGYIDCMTDSGINANDEYVQTFKVRKYEFTETIVTEEMNTTSSALVVQAVMGPDVNVTLSEAAANALTGIAIDFANLTITLTENRTASEIYDYFKAQFVKTANMQYTQKITWNGSELDLNNYSITGTQFLTG